MRQAESLAVEKAYKAKNLTYSRLKKRESLVALDSLWRGP